MLIVDFELDSKKQRPHGNVNISRLTDNIRKWHHHIVRSDATTSVSFEFDHQILLISALHTIIPKTSECNFKQSEVLWKSRTILIFVTPVRRHEMILKNLVT